MENDEGRFGVADRAVAATPSSPQAVSPVPASIPSADSLSRDERSFMLYAETCCVDAGGMLVGVRMNGDDHLAAARFQLLGLMFFGRVPSHLLGARCEGIYAPTGVTHWVELTDAGWQLAHELRRKRAARRGPYATRVISDELTQQRIAQAIEARRAATGTGAVHESAVAEGDAP